MSTRQYLRCKVCDQLLALREQESSNKNPFAFSFYCGKCRSKFNATRSENGVIYDGAGEVIDVLDWGPEESYKHDESVYVFEISWEFPIKNGYLIEHQNNPINWMKSNPVPWIRNAPKVFSDDKDSANLWLDNFEANKDNYYFYERYEDPDMDHSYDNSLIDIVHNKYSSAVSMTEAVSSFLKIPESKKAKWENATLFNYLITMEIATLFKMGKNVWDDLGKIDKYFNELFSDKEENVKKLLSFIKENQLFKDIVYRDNELLKSIHKIRQKFLPLFFIDDNDQSESISTLSIDEITSFYAESFEIIMNNFDLLILLNNLEKNNDLLLFSNDWMSFDENGIKAKKQDFKSGSKVNFIDNSFNTEKLGWIVKTDIISNSIRNYIYHRDYSFNPIKQKIVFGKEEKTMSLIDFARLDLNVIKTELYMHEVIWNLKRIQILN